MQWLDNTSKIADYTIMPVENKTPNPHFSTAVNAAFGEKVRNVRRSRDLSQAELAFRVGLSRVTISTIESGRQNSQLSQAFLIAKALDVPVEQLVPSLGEVEQRAGWRGGVASNPVTASGELFLEDARALLLQMKKESI
jgi:transcriptional regulator with XRE-family HTH domain